MSSPSDSDFSGMDHILDSLRDSTMTHVDDDGAESQRNSHSSHDQNYLLNKLDDLHFGEDGEDHISQTRPYDLSNGDDDIHGHDQFDDGHFGPSIRNSLPPLVLVPSISGAVGRSSINLDNDTEDDTAAHHPISAPDIKVHGSDGDVGVSSPDILISPISSRGDISSTAVDFPLEEELANTTEEPGDEDGDQQSDDNDDEDDEDHTHDDDDGDVFEAFSREPEASSAANPIDTRLLDPQIDPTLLYPNLHPFTRPCDESNFSFDRRVLPVNIYDIHGVRRYTSGFHLPDCGDDDPIGVNLTIPAGQSHPYSAGATINVPEFTDVNVYSIIKGYKRYHTPYPWWESNRAMNNVAAISQKRKSLLDEYVFCHIACYNLPRITKVGQSFTPFVSIQRERATRDGPSIWDTIASTEAIPYEMMSRRSREERIRTLSQFMQIPIANIPPALAECSPDFPLFVIPTRLLTEGDPEKCIRLLVQHRNESKAMNCAAVVVTVGQLRAAATSNTEKLYNMFKSGEDFNEVDIFNTKHVRDYLKLKLIGSKTELSQAMSPQKKNMTKAEQRREASRSPIMYMKLFQPLFEITPAIALTPLYKPVPLVTRQSLLYVQFCTNGFISGLRNSGKRKLLSAGYLIFRTFHRVKTNPSDLVDYTPADRERLSQEYHDAVLRVMTDKQQRKYRDVIEKINTATVKGSDVEDDMKGGLLLNYKKELEVALAEQKGGNLSMVDPLSSPSAQATSPLDNDADEESSGDIVFPKFESDLGDIASPPAQAIPNTNTASTQISQASSMLTDSFIQDSFSKATFQEVTVYSTPVSHATANLSWSFALPIGVMTGGTFDFDQQIKIVLMDALGATKREVGYTITTLRELVNQGTTPWKLYRESSASKGDKKGGKKLTPEEIAAKQKEDSKKLVITTPVTSIAAPVEHQNEERSKLANQQARTLAKIDKLTANLTDDRRRSHKTSSQKSAPSLGDDGVEQKNASSNPDTAPTSPSQGDSGRTSTGNNTRGRERSRVRNRERSQSGVRNRDVSRTGVRSKSKLREASRIYSRMDNEDLEFANQLDEQVSAVNTSRVRPRSVSRNRGVLNDGEVEVDDSTPRSENYLPPSGYCNTTRSQASQDVIEKVSHRPALTHVGSIICTGARLFSTVFHIEDAARRDFYFQVKSHAKCCCDRPYNEPSAYPKTPAYPQGLYVNESRKDRNIIYPCLHDNPFNTSSNLIRFKRIINWMEPSGLSCHLCVDGGSESLPYCDDPSCADICTGGDAQAGQGTSSPHSNANVSDDITLTDIQTSKPCLWWESDVNLIPDGLSTEEQLSKLLLRMKTAGTQCICLLSSYFDLLLDVQYQRTKQMGTFESKSALDVYRTMRADRTSSTFSQPPLSPIRQSSVVSTGSTGDRLSMNTIIPNSEPNSPTAASTASTNSDGLQPLTLPSLLHAFLAYLCSPRDLDFPRPPKKIRKYDSSASALDTEKSGLEDKTQSPIELSKQQSSKADQQFLSLNTTFADWLKNRRYDQYTSWKFACVNLSRTGMYELEVYVWRRGQYELLKVSPQVKAVKNGEILQVIFDPFIIRGLLMIENDKLRSATKPPPPPQHPRLTTYLTRRRRRRERRYLKLIEQGKHSNELAKIDIYAKINTEFIAQQIDLGLTPPRVRVDILDESDSEDDGDHETETDLKPTVTHLNGNHATSDKHLDHTSLDEKNHVMNDIHDDDEAFWTQDPQEQLGNVMGSPLYALYNRMLLSVSRPLGRNLFKSQRKLPLLGPAYTGVMKEEDQNAAIAELDVPLVAFPPEPPKDLTEEELKREFVDPFEDMRTDHECGRPASIIAINKRFARLRQGVEHLGFVEVMFEDLREQASYQRIKLEEKIKEARKIGSTSSLTADSDATRKERKDFEKRSKTWLFDQKLDLGRIDVNKIDHKDLALPLMNSHGRLQFPSIELLHVGLSSQQQKKTEQALEKLAKEARALQRLKEKERLQAMTGDEDQGGAVVTRAKNVSTVKPSKP